MQIMTSNNHVVNGPTPQDVLEFYHIGWVYLTRDDLEDMLAMFPAGKNICEKCMESEAK